MEAAERAALLTRQLLTFSRKQIIEPKVLDLNLLMADMSKMMVRLIGENLDLKTVPGKDLGPVKVDPGQLGQVLVNLAMNARDAMPDGGTLLIETANVELDEEYCAPERRASFSPIAFPPVPTPSEGLRPQARKVESFWSNFRSSVPTFPSRSHGADDCRDPRRSIRGVGARLSAIP